MPRFAVLGLPYEPTITQEEWKHYVTTTPLTVTKPKELLERLYGVKSTHKPITYHEAKSEGHLCQELLQTDKYFALSEWMVCHWKHDGPKVSAHPLMVAILKEVDPVDLWADEKKSWLTPERALAIWNVVNDVRRLPVTPRSACWEPNHQDLGFNAHEAHPFVYTIVPCSDPALHSAAKRN